MRLDGPSGPAPVLVAAAGSSWEAAALDRIERGSGLLLSKRCVDLTDLLATAAAGLASVAVVSPALPGLDADSVVALRRAGLGVVLVAAPEELGDGDTERLRRLGIDHVVASTELDSLAGTLASAGAGPAVRDEPVPWDDDATAGPTSRGRLVAVWGPTGAPGRTTVAVGLAGELAEAGHETLLVDADAYGGAVAQHLGVLDEVSGLLAAARAANAGRLDVTLLSDLARQVRDGLRVLTGLPRPDRWPEVRPAAFDDLLGRSAELAAYTVLDVGFGLEGDPPDPFGPAAPQRNQLTLTAVERADEVVVVGAADPVGLARLARGLVDLRDVVPGIRPRVVVNRTRPSLGWSDREIRGMVEGFVTPLEVHFLPDDRAAADRALMAGRTLAESGESSLRTAVAALAREVAGERPAAASRRGLRRRRAGRDR
jgi:MinD-like ATPase involved in chromosome partitioning or flagellar assembly